jgi:predicted nucleic acid-binding Zn ribbon protein
MPARTYPTYLVGDKKQITWSKKLLDLTGQKYGRWTVVKMAPRRKGKTFWECVCECGTVKEVRTGGLRNGISKSCGCWNNEQIRLVDHGMKDSPEWKSWSDMKQRCLNPNNKSYEHYGGRGIVVCERWKDNFVDFYSDMGPCDGDTIERIDVNGNYEPGNCKWIPHPLQARNKTTTRRITAFGREQLFSDWARELDMDPSLLHYHLKVGKTIEQIVNELNPEPRVCVCGDTYIPSMERQEFCSSKCKEIQRQKRRLAEQREKKACMFLVIKGEGKNKRYARTDKPTGFKWIVSKMWASTFFKNDAEIVAQKMGDGAIIEQRGLFVRENEYANMPIEKNGDGNMVARWRPV